MDKYKVKFTALQSEIFKLLCIKAGEKLNQRQISKLLKVSPTAIANSLPLLEKEELITKEKQKGMNLIWIGLNRSNKKIIQLKRVENLKTIYESGLISFLEEEFPSAAIILFGSYSRGDDTIKSDIDIAIIGNKEKKVDLKEYEQKFEKEIIINFYNSINKVHKELKENLCNGIILSGGIEF
jgi:predicted nucleotidyltransferase